MSTKNKPVGFKTKQAAVIFLVTSATMGVTIRDVSFRWICKHFCRKLKTRKTQSHASNAIPVCNVCLKHNKSRRLVYALCVIPLISK